MTDQFIECDSQRIYELERELWELRPRAIVPTLQAVADHFDRSLDTVKAWRSKGMPGTPGEGYDICLISRWLLAFGPWRTEHYRDEVLRAALLEPPHNPADYEEED